MNENPLVSVIVITYNRKELLKDKAPQEFEKQELKDIKGVTTKDDAPADSPLSKATNPHPDPKRK